MEQTARAAPHAASGEGGVPSRGYRVFVLAMLIVVYTFNFIDRQIIGILAGPIKAELALTDTQLGLMGGLAFALFYTALGIPIAWVADRTSRTWIMTIALTLWSGFTALCGFAQSFWQLFLCRLGVGVGEAGGVAPSYSLISDYFPPHERARALGVYSFGIPVGSALGIFLGGYIASAIDWRTAFLAVGLVGVVLAPIFRLVVREPKRGGFDAAPRTAAEAKQPGFGEALRILGKKPSFWALSFGAASCSIMGYGLFFWLPSFFQRTYGLPLVDVSLFFGSIVLVGGLIGIWVGSWLGDRQGTADPGAYARIPAIAFVLAAPCYAAGVMSSWLPLTFVLFLVPQALGLTWLGPIITAVQHLVAPNMRTTASAIFLFINNLIGIGFGTLFLGALSDILNARFGEDSLRYAILTGLLFYLVSAGLFWFASKRLARDWHR
ncbi:spinster family MFS transporter [Pedomonas mirosovicensis]|uniref:spinster family MFS transporter n=1 Tax=Pedomonas mirosovicensis TaxID=2908641 RepID=UPI0035BC3299